MRRARWIVVPDYVSNAPGPFEKFFQMAEGDFPISHRSGSIAIANLDFDTFYKFLHFCNQEVMVGRLDDQLVLDSIFGNYLTGQDAFVVDFPGPVFEGFDALIEPSGLLSVAFNTSFCGIPFDGVNVYFHGYLGTLAVAGDP